MFDVRRSICFNFQVWSKDQILDNSKKLGVDMDLSWEFPYGSQRMPVLAKNIVATSQPLAAQAGLKMLHNGGNAVDAALATAITLTVVEPTSNVRTECYSCRPGSDSRPGAE